MASHISGLSTYTPDGLFVLGPAPGLRILAATGCSGAGIAAAGGVGLVWPGWPPDFPSPFDLTPFRVDRFGPVDPLSPAFRQRCEQARSSKTSG